MILPKGKGLEPKELLMEMAKPYLDFGLQTNRGEQMIAFWGTEVGLVKNTVQPILESMVQHRYALGGGVLKLNLMATTLPAVPVSGYRRIIACRSGQESFEEFCDPDGTPLLLAPASHLGEQEMAVDMAVSELPAFRRFYGEMLGLTALGEDCFVWGKTQIRLAKSSDVSTSLAPYGPGIRYITFQIRNLDAVHAKLLAAGVQEFMAPTQLNSVAYISFVLDPDNNLVELAQRSDLQ
ncbi:MAG: VOC family protein [Parahaliea sp.]